MPRKVAHQALFLIGLMVAATACRSATPTPTPTPAKAAWELQWQEVQAKARQEGKLVISPDPASIEGWRKLFQTLGPRLGFEIETRVLTAAAVSALVLQECAANQPSLDLWTNGPSALFNILPKGCLAPIKPILILPEVTDGKNWSGGQLRFMDQQGQYMPTFIAAVYGTLLYNKNLIKPSDIRTSKNLLEPRFKGKKICSIDPVSAGAGRSDATYFLDTLGQDFVVQLYTTQDVTLTRDYNQLAEWVARGSCWIAIGHQTPSVEPLRAQGLPLAVTALADAPGYTVGGGGVLHLTKNARHPNAAAVFANWLLSKEGQKAWMEIVGEPTLRVDVEIPKNVPDYRRPTPGVTYVDQYEYKFYTERRTALVEVLVKALGR